MKKLIETCHYLLKTPMHLLVLSLLFTSPALTEAQAEKITEKIKVGVVAGYTGPWASYGTAYKQAIQLAGLEEVADLIYEDDQFLPRKTVSAVSHFFLGKV